MQQKISTKLRRYIVVVAVKKRKSNCSINKKEVIRIVAEFKRSNSTCSNIKRRKSNCSGFRKMQTIYLTLHLRLCKTATI
jgi:hypothetical protein